MRDTTASRRLAHLELSRGWSAAAGDEEHLALEHGKLPARIPERSPDDMPDRVEVLPPLQGRPTGVNEPARRGARLAFDQRTTRASRFPLEQALARIPEPPRLGRFLDVEV